MSARSAQRQLAEFVASAPIGWGMTEAAPIVRQAWLDTLAVSIAGVRTGVSRGVLAYADALGGAGRTHPWLSPRLCTPDTAALVDAAMAHALDYDDVTPAWRGHPSCVLFPALTALAVQCDATGQDVLRAYVVGFELGAHLGDALTGRHYEKGWHATATIGVVAATAAGCRLLRLPAHITCHAIGLALAQASGMQASFGSDAKALQAGFAAAGAVRSCVLAANGIGSTETNLDGPKGFVDLYADGWAAAAPMAELGLGPTAIVRRGIEMKLYPMCYAAHRAIEAALALREAGPVDVGSIDSIEIEGSPGAHTPLLPRLPSNEQEARFSVEFGVACALLDGGVRLGSFTYGMRARPEVQALMHRSRAREVSGTSTPRSACVRIRRRDGRVQERLVNRPANGSIDEGALMSKVVDCLDSVGVADEAPAIRAMFDNGLATPVAAMMASEPLARIRERISVSQRSPSGCTTANGARDA